MKNAGRTARLCAAAMTLQFVLMGASLPAHSQGDGMKQLLSGQTHPLTRKMKELNGDWRRIGTTGQFDMGAYFQGLSSMLTSLFGTAGQAIYYTRGETTTLGSETYLVAYRAPTQGIDFGALMKAGSRAAGMGGALPPGMAGAEGKPGTESKIPVLEKLTPETALTLALLNLRTIGSLAEIRAFDMEREIADSQKATGLLETLLADEAAAPGAEDIQDPSLKNLKKLGDALMAYAQDNNEVFPPMQSAATVKQQLGDYVDDESVFTHPETKQAYLPNPILSSKRLATVAEYADWMIAFYEATPAADGTRGVVTIGGAVKRIPEAEWEQARRASKLP